MSHLLKLKSFIKSSRIYTRLGKHFRDNYISHLEFISWFLQDNAWLFTQPKSGSNYICATVAFYNAERLGIKNYSFADRERLGTMRGARFRASDVSGYNAFRLISDAPVLIRVQEDVPDASAKFLVVVTRNILDFAVSMYYFTYQPSGIEVDQALEPIIRHYSKLHKAQIQAMQRITPNLLIHYEDLIENPKATYSELLRFLYGELDEACLEVALERASADSFKAWEKEQGAYINEQQKKHRSSFIRSGKIGEGETFFSAAQKSRIAHLLEKEGLSDLLDG